MLQYLPVSAGAGEFVFLQFVWGVQIGFVSPQVDKTEFTFCSKSISSALLGVLAVFLLSALCVFSNSVLRVFLFLRALRFVVSRGALLLRT